MQVTFLSQQKFDSIFIIFSDTSITFNAANPGLVRGTGHLEKYSSIGTSFIAKVSMWPWIWLFLKSPYQGCQTIVFLAVEPTLYRISGYFFRYNII